MIIKLNNLNCNNLSPILYNKRKNYNNNNSNNNTILKKLILLK